MPQGDAANIDVSSWRAHTTITTAAIRDGIRDDEIITWFWRLVGDLQEEERGLLLRYVSLSHGIVMSLITLSYVTGCLYQIDQSNSRDFII